MQKSCYYSPEIMILSLEAEGVVCDSTNFDLGDWDDDGIDQGGSAS